jgi:hypothetical protein
MLSEVNTNDNVKVRFLQRDFLSVLVKLRDGLYFYSAEITSGSLYLLV